MPPGKRKNERDDVSDSEEESEDEIESEDSDEYEDTEDVDEINVEFEAETALETDFHGIKQLLLNALILLHVDASELTDLIIAQEEVGSTVKIVNDEDDEVYGIFSILSLRKFQDRSCIKELKKELLSKSKLHDNEDGYAKLQDILENKNIGFLINERFINIPAQLAVPFHESLKEEVDTAREKESTFEFDYMLIISKTAMPESKAELDDQATSSIPKKKKKKKKRQKTDRDSDEIEYVNFEDEIFHQESEISFEYNVTKATGLAVGGNWDFEDQPMKTYRTVMLVPANKWTDILKKIKSMVKE